jgi:uncharacterized phage-associated protein
MPTSKGGKEMVLLRINARIVEKCREIVENVARNSGLSRFINKLYIVTFKRFTTTTTSREEFVNHARSQGSEGEQLAFVQMTYTPQHIANYFLDRAEAESRALTPLKLLKLVYIAYGWNLALTNSQLFREPIEAWQHGPVVPSIYHEFKHFRSIPITGRAIVVDYQDSEPGRLLDVVTPHVPESDTDTNSILSHVWESYRGFTGWNLRDMTHQHDTPWSRVYRDGVRGIQLRDSDIRDHYIEKIGKYIEQAVQKRYSPDIAAF